MTRATTVLFGLSMLSIGAYLGTWFSTMLLLERAFFPVNSGYGHLRTMANVFMASFVVGMVTLLVMDYRGREETFELGGEQS